MQHVIIWLCLILVFAIIGGALSLPNHQPPFIQVSGVDRDGRVKVGRYYHVEIPSFHTSSYRDTTLESCCLSNNSDQIRCEVEAVFSRWARKEFALLQHKWVISYRYNMSSIGRRCDRVYLRVPSGRDWKDDGTEWIQSLVFDLAQNDGHSSAVPQLLFQRSSISGDINADSTVDNSVQQAQPANEVEEIIKEPEEEYEIEPNEPKRSREPVLPLFVKGPVARNETDQICLANGRRVCQREELLHFAKKHFVSFPGQSGWIHSPKLGEMQSGYLMAYSDVTFGDPGFVETPKKDGDSEVGVYCCDRAVWVIAEQVSYKAAKKMCDIDDGQLCSAGELDEHRRKGFSHLHQSWIRKGDQRGNLATVKSFYDHNITDASKSEFLPGVYVKPASGASQETHSALCCRKRVFDNHDFGHVRFEEAVALCKSHNQRLCFASELHEYVQLGYSLPDVAWIGNYRDVNRRLVFSGDSWRTNYGSADAACCSAPLSSETVQFTPKSKEETARVHYISDQGDVFPLSLNITESGCRIGKRFDNHAAYSLDSDLNMLYISHLADHMASQSSGTITLDCPSGKYEASLTVAFRHRIDPEFPLLTSPVEDADDSMYQSHSKTFWDIETLDGPMGTINYRTDKQESFIFVITGNHILLDGTVQDSPLKQLMDFNNATQTFIPREDIYKVVIRADKITVRSPLVLPNSIIELYSREIEFGTEGYIKNTPITYSGEVKLDGVDGLDTPDIQIFTFKAPSDAQTKIFGDGGRGSAGLKSDSGPAPVYNSRGWKNARIEYMAGNYGPFNYVPENLNYADRHINNFYEIASQWESEEPFAFFANGGIANGGSNPVGQPPRVGTPVTGGKPGRGGNGARLHINHAQYGNIVSVEPGEAGPVTPEVSNFDAYKKAKDERGNCYSSSIGVVQHSVKDNVAGEYAKVYV